MRSGTPGTPPPACAAMRTRRSACWSTPGCPSRTTRRNGRSACASSRQDLRKLPQHRSRQGVPPVRSYLRSSMAARPWSCSPVSGPHSVPGYPAWRFRTRSEQLPGMRLTHGHDVDVGRFRTSGGEKPSVCLPPGRVGTTLSPMRALRPRPYPGARPGSRGGAALRAPWPRSDGCARESKRTRDQPPPGFVARRS